MLVLALLVTVASAAENLSHSEALALARENNPDLLAAPQELGVARGRLAKSRYWNQFNPEVGGAGKPPRVRRGGAASEFAVSGSQEIEVAGQRGRRIDEAERNAERVAALVRDRERLLTGDVTRAFFSTLAARRRLALQRTIEALNQRTLDATSARVKAGESPLMEANLAEIRYGQSGRESIAAAAEVATTTLEGSSAFASSASASVEACSGGGVGPNVRPVRLLLALLGVLSTAPTGAHAQVSATVNPIYHGDLRLRPALGTLDRRTGAAVMRMRGWRLRPSPDSNGLYPDREPILVALKEDTFRIEPGEVRRTRGGKRFSYRARPARTRGVQVLRLTQRVDGSYEVRLTLVGLELSALLFEDPGCYPMALIVGDDDGFSGIKITRKSFTSGRIAITDSCTPNTNWVWLERCGPNASNGC